MTPELRPLRVAKQSRREVFGRFRPPGALNGPRGLQKTIQDEKPVLGRVSGPLGADVAKKSRREVFGRFRPPGAFNGTRERQETNQDERTVPGKVSGPLGADVAKKSRRRMSGEEDQEPGRGGWGGPV